MRTVYHMRLTAGLALCQAVVLGGMLNAMETGADTNRPPVDLPEAAPAAEAETGPVVVIETSRGSIRAELWPDKAPATVAEFLQYADAGFYDGLVFHRVIDGFMIQGGGFDGDLQRKATRDPIRNEARPDTPNNRGTLAMARTRAVHSATSQFYINLADNPFLNHKDDTPQGYGYCVFGKVVSGMEVVDAIGKAETKRSGPFQNLPVEPIVILGIRRAE